jgi:hypothetical protein
MATPKELVTAVAKEAGVAVNTVIQHDRNLSLAGLRSVGGRGRAAATVTYQDAANLIIAVAASRNVKDSSVMVQLYSNLEAKDAPAWGGKTWGRTFGEALAELLEVVPANREDFGGEDANRITVSIYGPRPRATIEVWVRPTKEKPTHTFEYDKRWQKGESQKYADLTFISQFTQITLGLVGEAIAGEAAD